MKKLYIAVVTNKDPKFSARTEGDLSCFVSDVKEEAVQKAIDAAQRWSGMHRQNDPVAERHYVHYRVLVGELKQEARMPIELFELGEL